MVGTRIRWQTNGKVDDSTFYEPEGSGRGIRTEWHSNGMMHSRGPMINGNRHGLWTYYQRSGKIASEELYDMDSLVSIRCFNEMGQPFSENCVVESEAAFPGGLSAWQRYISGRIFAASDELLARAQEGTVMVQFIIDTSGNVTDVKVLNQTGSFLDEFARRTVQRSPKWIPARQHNIAVKAFRRQPVTYRRIEE
jgi:TonB family protein